MESKSPLIGMFFHSWNHSEGKSTIGWQGVIEREIESGFYLCQLFDWFVGYPSCLVVVHLEDMVSWRLYEDEDSWKNAAEQFKEVSK